MSTAASSRSADLNPLKMLRDARTAGSVKLHRGKGVTDERQDWAEHVQQGDDSLQVCAIRSLCTVVAQLGRYCKCGERPLTLRHAAEQWQVFVAFDQPAPLVGHSLGYAAERLAAHLPSPRPWRCPVYR